MVDKEYTLIMIKPDAVKSGYMGKIIDRIIQNGFHIRALKQLHLSLEDAKQFYLEHKDRPFYDELTRYMASSPIVAAFIEKENAVDDWRKMIGATDPAEAEEGSIRKDFGKSKGENAVHGSDSIESAKRETAFFFSGLELTPFTG